MPQSSSVRPYQFASGTTRHAPEVGTPSQASAALPVFVGRSDALQDLLRRVDRLAPYDHLPLLLEGESGTGKSFIARLVHLKSPRARGAYHQVILSALDDNLASSDLFGHVSGAYTDARHNRPGHFVSANGGTLFLDEIGKASASVQRKLLHAVEHREVWPVGADRALRLDVRLVAATNHQLDVLCAKGEFLPDLMARLANFRIQLPALRDRRGDIPALVEQFIGIHASRCGHPGRVPRVNAAVMDALLRAEWPYNLRQLEGVVQRLLMEAAPEQTITMEHCVDDLRWLRGDEDRVRDLLTPELVRQRFTELKSVMPTARSFGVSRWTIYRYLKLTEGQHAG